LASAVFAADFAISVGAGALLGGAFTKSSTDPADMSGGLSMVLNDLAYKTKTFDVGAFLFVDATYAELSVAYLAEIGGVTGTASTAYSSYYPNPLQSGTTEQTPIDEDYLSHVLIVDLLGKYPFVLNEKFTVFPALGVGLKFPFAGNENSDKEHDVTWGVVVKAGAGLDFSLTQSLFLRCEALFGYQFISDQEAKIERDLSALGQGKKTFDYQFQSAGYNMGPQVKIGVGYKVL
jgi:hypothetical protein